jgi:hypothetical protein
MRRSRAFVLLCLGFLVEPARVWAQGAEVLQLSILLPWASTKGTIWSAKASAKAPGDPEASSPSSAGSSVEQPSSNSSGGPQRPGDLKPMPRKVYFPIQMRNEAAQWLAERGTPPLLLRTTLAAYHELRCAEASPACALSDAELVTEVLLRSEPW